MKYSKLAKVGTEYSPLTFLSFVENSGKGLLGPHSFLLLIVAVTAICLLLYGLTVTFVPAANKGKGNLKRYSLLQKRLFFSFLTALGTWAFCLLANHLYGVASWDHNKERAYERAMEAMADEEAARLIDGVAVHWYSGDHFENLQLIRDRFPDKQIIFSEACVEYGVLGSGNDLRNAQMYAHDIIGNFNHGMNAFLDWNLLLDEKGGPNHVGNYCDAPIMYDTRTGELHKKLSYDYIGHFSRYIQPGAHRIGLSRFSDRLEATAFLNPDGSVCAVVLNRQAEDVSFFLRINGRVYPVTQAAGSIGTLQWERGELA